MTDNRWAFFCPPGTHDRTHPTNHGDPARKARLVWHTPNWQPAPLPINAHGDTRPGYVCVHELENGNGQCGGNVFDIDEEIGNHCCFVLSDEVVR